MSTVRESTPPHHRRRWDLGDANREEIVSVLSGFTEGSSYCTPEPIKITPTGSTISIQKKRAHESQRKQEEQIQYQQEQEEEQGRRDQGLKHGRKESELERHMQQLGKDLELPRGKFSDHGACGSLGSSSISSSSFGSSSSSSSSSRSRENVEEVGSSPDLRSLETNYSDFLTPDILKHFEEVQREGKTSAVLNSLIGWCPYLNMFLLT